MERNDILYAITVDDIQYHAMMKIGRELTDDELEIAQEGYDWGLDICFFDVSDEILNIIQEKNSLKTDSISD